MRANLLLTTLAAAALLAGDALAETITGRVVDADGNGVPFVNIRVENNGSGGDPDVFNGGTDALGFFTTTVTPGGVFDVVFEPQPPPSAPLLTRVYTNMAVVGTVNMASVVLTTGVALSGTCVDSNGLPVGGVNINVVDPVTKKQIPTVADSTNGFGMFNIAVRTSAIDLQFDATGLVGRTIVSRSFSLVPTTSTNLGNIVLPLGFKMSGKVTRVNGTPVPDADVDAIDSVTRQVVYTPGDNTNSLGNFEVVVPEGTFDLVICPPTGPLLVATGVKNVPVSSTTNVGTLVMVPGVVLFGTVLDYSGAPVQGVNIDVKITATGQDVFLCGDGTSAAGTYSVIAPLDTVDVHFKPSFSQPLGSATETVTLVSNTLLDASLPACPFLVPYGKGTAGTGGVAPLLTTVGGAPRTANASFRWQVQDGLPGAPVLLVNSLAPQALPFFGGTLLVDPRKGVAVSRFGTLDGSGAIELGYPFPGSFLSGFRLFTQAFVSDPAGPQGWSFSRGVMVDVCP